MTLKEFFDNKWFYMKYKGTYPCAERLLTR